MIIRKNTRMSSLPLVSILQKVWDKDLMEMIGTFDVPERIKFIRVTPKNKIPIKDIFKMWDIQDDESLVSTTIDIFLKNNKLKKFLYWAFIGKEKGLPMIDFLRLCSHTEQTSKYIGGLFDALKREPEDENQKAIFAKYNGSKFDFIQRFCSIAPAYTYDQAYELPWPTIYMAFRSKAMADDIDKELAELEMSKIKNK